MPPIQPIRHASQNRLVRTTRKRERATDERRSFKRQRVLKSGTIETGGGGAIDCTVRVKNAVG
jgi:hypothetical protein